jgi:hypothetical protein
MRPYLTGTTPRRGRPHRPHPRPTLRTNHSTMNPPQEPLLVASSQVTMGSRQNIPTSSSSIRNRESVLL